MGRDEGKVRARGGNVPDVVSRYVVKEKRRD
jgi:hypothetical protein